MFPYVDWASSSVWLERALDKREVGSSSLPRPTINNGGISSAGRAPDLHSGGQRFDPAILHQETFSYLICKYNYYQYLYPNINFLLMFKQKFDYNTEFFSVHKSSV